jgi:hypothetical protein
MKKLLFYIILFGFSTTIYSQEPKYDYSGQTIWDADEYYKFEARLKRRQTTIKVIGSVIISGIVSLPLCSKDNRNFIKYKIRKSKYNRAKKKEKKVKEKEKELEKSLVV